MTASLTIPHRFCGPPHSGNGGWTGGALAAHLGEPQAGPVRVMLRKPPPLDVALAVTLETDGGVTTASATRGDVLVAAAAPAEAGVGQVDHVSLEQARAAETRFAGHTSHPFDTCFSCGTAREPGDGLRIFPGRVDDDAEGRVRVAATWTPDPGPVDGPTDPARDGSGETPDEASLPIAWAALDCVGGWAGDLTERLMVLGSMTVHVHALPRVGEEHVLVGGARGTEGRRTFTASTLYDATGRALASAEHVWFAVDPKDFA